MQLPNHTQSTQDPPTITDILQLLRPPIQTPIRQLPLGQPPANPIFIYAVERVEDGEGSDADPRLGGVRFGAGACAEAAIGIVAVENVSDGEFVID